MKVTLWILLAATWPVGLQGQVAAPTAPRNTNVDDPRVQVRELSLPPHQPSSPEEHAVNRVVVFRQPGEMTFTTGGKVEKFTVKAAEVRWIPAGRPYVMENTTDHPMEMVEVDLKNTPADPPLVLSKLDMLVSDPEHYKFVMENVQVRVLSVRYGPHEKGAMHEHARSRVIVNLNDELRAKYGDVRLIAPESHAEENKADHADERIVVELK